MALMVTVIEESRSGFWERMLYGEIDWSETREETGIGVAAVVTFGGDRIPQVISNHSDPLTENLLHRWVTVSGKHRYGDTTVFNFLSHDHLRFCVKQRVGRLQAVLESPGILRTTTCHLSSPVAGSFQACCSTPRQRRRASNLVHSPLTSLERAATSSHGGFRCASTHCNTG
ncbi:unnamed protein product [Gadus morhua 'NCC']